MSSLEHQEYDKVSRASLNGIYVKAQELDRGHNAVPAPACAPVGHAASDADAHATTHASDAQSHTTTCATACADNRLDASTHASDASTHATGY